MVRLLRAWNSHTLVPVEHLGGLRPDNLKVARMGDLIHRISKTIPAEVYLERGGRATSAIIDGPTEARLVNIDAVGKHHAKKRTVTYRNYTVREAIMWEDRWAGPFGSTKAWAAQHSFRFLSRDPIWLSELSRSEGNLEEATGISMITRAKAKVQMKRPAAEAVWTTRLGWIDFKTLWRIRADYVTPRDQVAWLKIMHLNLRVATSSRFRRLG